MFGNNYILLFEEIVLAREHRYYIAIELNGEQHYKHAQYIGKEISKKLWNTYMTV